MKDIYKIFQMTNNIEILKLEEELCFYTKGFDSKLAGKIQDAEFELITISEAEILTNILEHSLRIQFTLLSPHSIIIKLGEIGDFINLKRLKLISSEKALSEEILIYINNTIKRLNFLQSFSYIITSADTYLEVKGLFNIRSSSFGNILYIFKETLMTLSNNNSRRSIRIETNNYSNLQTLSILSNNEQPIFKRIESIKMTHMTQILPDAAEPYSRNIGFLQLDKSWSSCLHLFEKITIRTVAFKYF